MPNDMGKPDLRLVKTEKVMNEAMFSLLDRCNFGRITVRDICEQAQISRATFYSRYSDKYDFLRYWLNSSKSHEIMTDSDNIELLNNFISDNKSVIRNLICDADDETITILSEFALSVFSLPEKLGAKQQNTARIVTYNFYAGGIIHYFQWLAKNKFPGNINPVNPHLLNILEKFREFTYNAEITE